MASEDLLKKAVAAFNDLSPEQQAEMREEQRQSWVRGNIGLSRDERGMTTPVAPVSPDATGEPWPYQKTFNAIAAATRLEGGCIFISVKDFVEAFGPTPDATGKCGELETVAWTNKAQLSFLKDDQWKVIPMAMWAKEYQAASDDDIGLCDRSQAEELLAAERAEKEEARRAEEEAKDCFWSIYETYLEKGGLPVSTEGARSALSNRIASLEADNAAKAERIKELEKDFYDADKSDMSARDLLNDREAEIEVLEAKLAAAEKALEPFAEYCGDHFDKDFNGNPLPDEQKVGWVYLNYGHFRRARAVMGGKPS